MEVEDDDQALLLLRSLPPSYGRFVKTILSEIALCLSILLMLCFEKMGK